MLLSKADLYIPMMGIYKWMEDEFQLFSEFFSGFNNCF